MEEKLPFETIEREVLVKKEAETSDEYGTYPEKRSIEELIKYGIVNINKPQGPTSHQVTSYVKDILEIKKAGHSGTLDPNVTGCLPMALENVTKIVQTLLLAGKEYICLMHLHSKIPEEKIYETANSFLGNISQLPPKRSAVKRVERTRQIYYFKILEIQDQDVLFKIGSQAGTYIRKICSGFGEKLNTNAHMQQLVRTKAGPFSDKEWYSLHDLKDAYEFYKEGNDLEIRKIIKPIESAVVHLPHIWLNDLAVNTVTHGANLAVPGISKLHSEINPEDTVALFTLKNELIGLGKALITSEEMIEKPKALAVKTSKIIYPRNVYPKFTK